MTSNKDKSVFFEKVQTSAAGPPMNYLVANGKKSPDLVKGAIIEQFFSVGNGYILITNDDCPMEESLNISFLNKDLMVLDSVTLARPYQTGQFKNFKQNEDQSFEFVFFDTEKWIFKILPQPMWNWPIFHRRWEASYEYFFKTYFEITKM